MAENRTFGEWLRWLREQTGRSQTYMADVLGVHPSQISRWEHGRMRPTPDQLVKIIQFLRDERPARLEEEEWEKSLQLLEESYGQNPILSSMIETLFQRSQKLPQLRAMIQKFLADLYEILGGLIATDEAIQGRLWETANHQLQQLTNKLEDNHFSDRLSLELNRRKGFVYYRLLRYDRALETIDQVIAQAKKIRDLRAQGEVLVLRGDLNRRMGKFDGARQDFRTALECYDQLNGPEGIYGKVRCYRKMAITYLLQGWPKRAEYVLSLARVANTQLGDFTEEFKIQQAQAWINLQQGRWDQAVAAHQEVVARLQARQDLDPWVLAKAFRYMGDAYRIARQYEKAEDSYNTAQQICNQLRAEGRDTRLIEAMIALGLARIKLRQPDMHQAQAWIKRAKQFIEAIQMDSRIPEAKMELAELMWQLNDHQQSWTLLGEAQK
ncbi:tetratricopeptide repeat protein [Thermoflexus sp.]|uniref:tetratricopeptide repeat protein n=1 Tax=Thermoflexus sp. TaxID=1969742 RepID=UPI0033235177